MKKLLILLALLLMPSLVLADSPVYNIIQTVPTNIIAGSNESINYSFSIRTTDTVPIYFQFNISGTKDTNTTGEFNLTGRFLNQVYCNLNTTSSIINCYDNNTEIYLGQGNYNLYMFLYTQPYASPDNYTISINIVSDIKQVDYQQTTNTIYYNGGNGGISIEYRNITNNTINPPTIINIRTYQCWDGSQKSSMLLCPSLPKNTTNNSVSYVCQNGTVVSNISNCSNVQPIQTNQLLIWFDILISIVGGLFVIYVIYHIIQQHAIKKIKQKR